MPSHDPWTVVEAPKRKRVEHAETAPPQILYRDGIRARAHKNRT